MDIIQLVTGGALALLGLALCLFGAVQRRAAWGVQSLLWAAAGLLLGVCVFGGVGFPATAAAGVWWAVIGGAALVLGVLAAIWPGVGGAVTGFFATFTVGLCLMWLVFGWPQSATLKLVLALFGGLLLGTLSALWPRGAYFVWAPATGALACVTAVYLLAHGRSPAEVYACAAQGLEADILYYGIAAGVLWLAGMAVQIGTAVKQRKALEALAADVLQAPARKTKAAMKAAAAAAQSVSTAAAAAAQSVSTAAPAAAAPAAPADAAGNAPLTEHPAAPEAAAPAAPRVSASSADIPAPASAQPEVWYCSACGAKNSAKFCTRCGHPR